MKPLRTPLFSTRRIVIAVMVSALCGTLAWYAMHQARFLLAGPEIVVFEPSVQAVSGEVVIVSGTARNAILLTLNGRPLDVTKEGHFREELLMPQGYTIMTLSAADRYGRTTTISRELVHTTPS